MLSNSSRSTRIAGPCVMLSILLGTAASSAQAQWTVTNLHTSGALSSAANGGGAAPTSNQQVGYAQLGPTVGDYRASLWSGTASSWINLHPAGTVYSIAHAADGGKQVGEVFPTGLPHAALWSGTAASWIDLHPPGQSTSSAFGVGGGQQVGNTNLGGYHAAVWTGSAASWVDLNPPPTDGYNHSSEAFATDGTQQVGYVIAVGGVLSASVWTGSVGSWVNLHPPGTYTSKAYGVGGGHQVGYVQVVAGSPTNAALWSGSAASWVNLNPAGATNSYAAGVLGSQQVGYADVGGSRRASLWTGTAASWTDLSAFLPAGFGSVRATSISTDGSLTYVTGRGFNTLTGRDEALLWTRTNPPPPCPADINGDHTVNTVDLTTLLGHFGQAVPTGTLGDINNDSVVNTADLVLLLGQFGQAC